MRAHPRVVPLEAAWADRLAALARRRGWPTDARTVGGAVAELSAAYNASGRAPAALDPGLQAARLLFFLPRDVAKAAGAVRDVPVPAGRPLRILDLGAGLGATSLGVLRGWGGPPAFVRAVEPDPDAAALIPEILAGQAEVEVDRRPLDQALHGTWDAVLLGQVVCELQPREAPEARVAAHAELLARARDLLAPGGALVVIEPALRAGTRHLQQVRDALAARGLAPFAPCPHDAPCPMLARPGDWCHEWLDCALPAWVRPFADAAGLRSEGVTFARLVLRHGPERLAGSHRATADVAPSKGRRDVWACGTVDGAPGWRKIGRQDRHVSPSNAAFDDIQRGDRFDVAPDDVRVGPASHVVVLP